VRPHADTVEEGSRRKLGLMDLDTPPDLLRFHGVPRRLWLVVK